MADRPIIFSAPMVRALLAGRKTQTRRLLRNPEYYGCPTGDCPHDRQSECDAAMRENALPDVRYKVGDRLYVREALYLDPLCIPANIYRADEQRVVWRTREQAVWLNEYAHRNVPSIHMPRWASRLTLTVTDVRVQQLQAIIEADAKEEGVDPVDRSEDFRLSNAHRIDLAGLSSHLIGFERLWNSLHGTNAWDDNPWVVALTFTAEQRNIDG